MLIGKIDNGSCIKGIVEISPKFTVTFKDGETVLQRVPVIPKGTAIYNGTVPAKDGNAFLGWVLSEPSNPIVDSDNVTAYQQISNVTEDITYWAVYSDKRIIHDSWDVISQRSQECTAQNYYSVGDMKRIHIEGDIGDSFVNRDVYVHILGFNHNSELEGMGITFGCFRRTDDFKDICLVCNFAYGTYEYKGTKVFNINHWGYATPTGNPYSRSYGGWAGSDIRYDILGSTDVQPSGYGTVPDMSRVGYDATSTCATNPVADTLMSCLPSDLRAVMKPITKYTDNTGQGSHYPENAVTATVDYLPLLSEYEVCGEVLSANPHEYLKQAQYDYFNGRNNYVKYGSGNYFPSSFSADWWLRSPSGNFCKVSQGGGVATDVVTRSLGLAPIFLV